MFHVKPTAPHPHRIAPNRESAGTIRTSCIIDYGWFMGQHHRLERKTPIRQIIQNPIIKLYVFILSPIKFYIVATPVQNRPPLDYRYNTLFPF